MLIIYRKQIHSFIHSLIQIIWVGTNTNRTPGYATGQSFRPPSVTTGPPRPGLRTRLRPSATITVESATPRLAGLQCYVVTWSEVATRRQSLGEEEVIIADESALYDCGVYYINAAGSGRRMSQNVDSCPVPWHAVPVGKYYTWMRIIIFHY